MESLEKKEDVCRRGDAEPGRRAALQHVRRDHGAERQLLQVRELRKDERLRVTEIFTTEDAEEIQRGTLLWVSTQRRGDAEKVKWVGQGPTRSVGPFAYYFTCVVIAWSFGNTKVAMSRVVTLPLFMPS